MTDTWVYPPRSQRPSCPSGAQDWRDLAACGGLDPGLFFPIGNAGPAQVQIAQAKQVCAGCPVRTPCLEWALASGQETGVWGGTSEDERRALRQNAVRSRMLPAQKPARAIFCTGGEQ
jgi:WhiB family transcriptional regulator, redox-sensing transcriptional regulator